MKHFHRDTRIMCLSRLWYFSFEDAVLMSNFYLQSFQIWNILSSKKRMYNFHYDMGIKSKSGSQIFPTLAILVACNKIFYFQNKQYRLCLEWNDVFRPASGTHQWSCSTSDTKKSSMNCCFQYAWVQQSLVLGANLNEIQNCSQFCLKLLYKIWFLNFSF